MRSKTKHGRLEVDVPLDNLSGGLDYSIPVHQLGAGKLYEATNLFYDIHDGKLKTRPGLAKYLDFQITGLRQVKSVNIGNTKHVVAAGSTDLFAVYSTAYQTLGALSGGEPITITPFENNFYVASGGTLQRCTSINNTLQDAGGVWWPCTGAPKSSIIVAKSGRLFANDIESKDIILASGVLDDSTFLYPDGIAFRAGWKDGDGVVGMIPLGDDLLIFKGPYNRSIHALKGIYPNWQMVELVRHSGVYGPNAIARVGSQVIVLDTDGLNSIAGAIEYGDLKADPVGNEIIGAMINLLDGTGFIVNWASQGILLCFPNNHGNVAFALHYNISQLVPQWRWTKFEFGIDGICSGDYDGYTDTLFLASNNGYIYTMTQTPVGGVVYTDDGNAYSTKLRTKVFDPPGQQILLKRFNAHMEPLATGSGKLYAHINDMATTRELASFDITEEDTIGSSDSVTIDADTGLIGMVASSATRSHRHIRANNIQFGIEITSGAAVIDRLYARAAIVGRE